jgi:hypothetical protein
MADTDPLATPMKRAGFRDSNYVQSIVLRMGTGYVDALDRLCDVNDRSRRQIVEILVAEAYADLVLDPENRITPL